MSKIKIFILSVILITSIYTKAQSTDKYEIFIVIPTTQTLGDQKINIDFFRDFFGTNECTYISTSNSYKISTIHQYNQVELEEKIKKQPNYSNVSISIPKSTNTNNSSEL